MLKAGDVVPNNNHFDTTRANVEVEAAEARDLVIAEGRVPSAVHPFKGNMDLAALERTLAADGDRVPLVMVTVTNNSGAGSPSRSRTCAACARCATATGSPSSSTPAGSPRTRTSSRSARPASAGRTPREIAREMFSLADGCTMSAKKDGLANIGGFLAMNDDAWAERCRNLLILTEGFPTYGGLAGYDLEAVARGLEEVLEEPYLRYRIRSTEYLARAAHRGRRAVHPAGGRPRRLHRRAGAPPARPAAPVPRASRS